MTNTEQTSIGHFKRGSSLYIIDNESNGITFEAYESYRKAYDGRCQFKGHNAKVEYDFYLHNRPYLSSTVFVQVGKPVIVTDMVFHLYKDYDFASVDGLMRHVDVIKYLQIVDKHYRAALAPMYIACLVKSVIGSGMVDFFIGLVYSHTNSYYNVKMIESLFEVSYADSVDNEIEVRRIFCKQKQGVKLM